MSVLKDPSTARIFYDGHCGLCHRIVRFVLANDPTGSKFRFAPLQSKTFQTVLSRQPTIEVLDSVVVETHDGELLFRSAALLYILERLGGVWRTVARISRLVPRPLSDASYDFIARIRHRLFQRPTDTCPVIPPEIRNRFDL